MHSVFQGEKPQRGRLTGIATPNSFSEKAAAHSIAIRPVRLQQRGPPISAFFSRHCAASFCGTAHCSGVMGEAPLTILAKTPAPAAAPHTP